MTSRGFFVTVTLTVGFACLVGLLAFSARDDVPVKNGVDGAPFTEVTTVEVFPQPSVDPETFFPPVLANWEKSWVTSSAEVRDSYCRLWATDAQSVINNAAVPSLPVNIPSSEYLRSFANFIASKCGEPNSDTEVSP